MVWGFGFSQWQKTGMRNLHMGASKSERRLAMWVGIVIGVAVSSMLVRFALQKKGEKDANRPGNFESQLTAMEGKPFSPVPVELRERFPNAVVVHYEENATEGPGELTAAMRSWVVETVGSFRSERLFVLVDEIRSDENEAPTEEPVLRYLRASEALVRLMEGVTGNALEKALDGERFSVIGKNSETGKIVVQFRDVSPLGMRTAIRDLSDLKGILTEVSPYPFAPPKRQRIRPESR